MIGVRSAKSSDSPPPNSAKFARYAAHLTSRKPARETIRVFATRLSGTVVSVSARIECERRKGAVFAEEFRTVKTTNKQLYKQLSGWLGD
jgi:hypothetical protein